MLGKLVSMITRLRRLIINSVPIKAMMLNLDGAGASNPTINTSYNVDTVVRTGVGVYRITAETATFYGVPIGPNSIVTTGFVIASSATSEAYVVNVEPAGGLIFDVSVYAMVVGSGSKLELNAYDILVGDTVTLSLLLNAGNGELPREDL